jgi:hypothetical protein
VTLQDTADVVLQDTDGITLDVGLGLCDTAGVGEMLELDDTLVL